MTVDISSASMTVKVIGPYFQSPAVKKGDLFIDLDGWKPIGSDAQHYSDDSMDSHGQPWDLVFNLKNSALYDVDDGYIRESQYTGIRYNQEWKFVPDHDAVPIESGSWNINGDTLTMMFDIDNTDIFKVKEIGLHWTMECANDVVAGSVPVNIPEPSTMLLLGAGMLGLAFFARRT
jgi:hypothetical protein